jgi:hypothetical protein
VGKHAEAGMMLAIAAAVLFIISLIFQLIGFALGPIIALVLITAGLICLALDLVGRVGPRPRGLSRR